MRTVVERRVMYAVIGVMLGLGLLVSAVSGWDAALIIFGGLAVLAVIIGLVEYINPTPSDD